MKKLQGKEQKINRKFNELTEDAKRITMQNAMIEIAEIYNVDVLTIRKCITKENLIKAKNRLTNPQLMVYNKLEEGKTQSQIARELNVSRQNIGIALSKIRKKGYNVQVEKFKRD